MVEFVDWILGERRGKRSDEVFTPVVGTLETPIGTITQLVDPDNGKVYSTEFSTEAVQQEAERRGVGSDFTIGAGGKVVEVHPRFQRASDNHLNSSLELPKKRLPSGE